MDYLDNSKIKFESQAGLKYHWCRQIVCGIIPIEANIQTQLKNIIVPVIAIKLGFLASAIAFCKDTPDMNYIILMLP